ncbi:MAG: RDD family protein [Bacteroidetes bacterium]|nr:RDD family protein [Bacteroidota bacterium]
MKYATVANRIYARLLDILIYYSVLLLFYWIIISKHNNLNNNMLLMYMLFYGMVFRWLVYYPLMEASGGIIGKRILGMDTVSRETGLPITIAQSYKRTWYVIKGILFGYIPVIGAQVLMSNGGNASGSQMLVYLSIACWMLWLIRTYFLKEFGFPRHDYASLVVVKEKNKMVDKLIKQLERENPELTIGKPKIHIKIKIPAMPKINIGKGLALYAILLVFTHAMFHFNRTYTVGSIGTFSADQYDKYTKGSGALARRVVEITTVKYFNTFPEWSINIIYAGYLLLAVGLFLFYNNKKQKQPLSLYQKRIIGMNALLKRMNENKK